MNKKFIKNIFINSLIVSGLFLSSLQASATGFHEGLNNKGKTISSSIYGDGKAGLQIADLLAELPLQFHKTITY